MTDSSRITELISIARGLGFEVICHEDVSAVDPETLAGVRLHGNGTCFGGTVGECAAFLVGWGTLRSRLLEELCASNGQRSMGMTGSSPLRESIGSQKGSPVSWWAPRGSEFMGRGSTRGGAALLSAPVRESSGMKSTVSIAGENTLERLLPRDRRQAMIAAWAELAFGREEATGLPQRGLRLLEEAIAAFQACGGPVELAHELVTYVFKRPCGMIGQELGGVAVALLALAAAAGRSADAEECLETQRVLSKPVEEFSRRNAAKNAAGFKVSAVSAPAPKVL